MNFELTNFSFNIDQLTTTEEVDKLLEEFNLKVKDYSIKLNRRDLLLQRAQNRSDNLTQDIAKVETAITEAEATLANKTPGSPEHEEADIALQTLKLRLRNYNFRKSQEGSTNTPLAVVESSADLGEAQLMFDYFTNLVQTLEQRKTDLGG